MEVSINDVMLLLAEKEVEIYVLKKKLAALSAELRKAQEKSEKAE